MAKKIIICLLLTICLIFSGCSYTYTGVPAPPPSGGGGSGGSGTGGGGGSGGSSNPDDTQPPLPVNGINGHKALEDVLYGIRLTYKKQNTTDSEKAQIIQEIEEASQTILGRLLGEYAPDGYHYTDVTLGSLFGFMLTVDINSFDLDPFVPAQRAAFCAGLNIPNGAISYDDVDIATLSKAFLSSPMSTITSGSDVTGLIFDLGVGDDGAGNNIIQVSQTGTDSFNIVNNTSWGLLQTATVTNMCDDSSNELWPTDYLFPLGDASSFDVNNGTYHIEYLDGSDMGSLDVWHDIYMILGQDNVNTFVSAFNSGWMTDTHADAIRYNLDQTNALDAANGQINTAAWNWTLGSDEKASKFSQDYIYTYQTLLAVNIAKLLVFNTDDIPDISQTFNYAGSPVTENILSLFNSATGGDNLAAQKFITFCSNYIDHYGFSPMETDLISEFVLNNVIGTSLVTIDNSKYVNNINDPKTAAAANQTFDSNETSDTGYRKLISDYNNLNARYNTTDYNSIFNSINYSTDINNIDQSGTPNLYDSKQDIRKFGFKNYTNTVYASVYYAQSIYPAQGILQYLDVTESYSSVVFSYGTDDYTDTDLLGVLQSAIIMPKQAMSITFLDFLIMPDYRYLNVGDTLTVTPLLSYYSGDFTYQTWLAQQSLTILSDGTTNYGPDTLEVMFDYTTAIFRNSSGQLVNNLNIAVDAFNGAGFDPGSSAQYLGPFLIKPADPGQIKSEDNTSVPLKDVVSPESYITNNFSDQLKASFVYNANNFRYVEVSFVYTLNGKPFNYPYGMGACLAGAYGDYVAKT